MGGEIKNFSDLSERGLYTASKWGQKFHNLPGGLDGIHQALGAGAAGPGKSMVLLMDPIYQVMVEAARCRDRHDPHYHPYGMSTGWCLHLRRTRPMLDQTIARSMRIFRAIDPGAKYHSGTTTWKFSSGYRYQFGHCKDPGDWEIYMSNEYCMAKGERAVMGDSSLKAIEAIEVGDEVMTLEGPRKVTHTYDTGIKPCVSATIEYQGETVGTHVFPTTHPVLTWTTDEWRSAQSPDSPRSGQRVQPHGYVWQDYESLLYGRPESPVRRVSSIAQGSGSEGFDGSLPEPGQLPTFRVPVALHAPTLQRALEHRRSPTQSHTHDTGHPRSASLPPAFRLPSAEMCEGTARGDARCRLGHLSTSGIPACDGTCGPIEWGIATGCPGDCSAGLYPHGGQLPPESAPDQSSAPPLAGAEERTPTDSVRSGRARTHGDTPPSPRSYPHFYTGEVRVQTEDVRRGTADLSYAGLCQTYDLTVEGANHYITVHGLVASQTYVGFDELVQFEKEQFDNIDGRLRSSDPVLCHMIKTRAATNPVLTAKDMVGVKVRDPQWVRKYFVEPHPDGVAVIKKRIVARPTKEFPEGEVSYRKRVYLPATLYDNPDPFFVKQFERNLLGKPEHIKKALLYGDWYVTEGAFYSEAWDPNIHVVKPYAVPFDWPVFRTMDWGFKRPGCVHWWAMDPDENLVCFRELTFLKKSDEEVAGIIREIELQEGLWIEDNSNKGLGKSSIMGPADTQLWEHRGNTGLDKAAAMAAKGVSWNKAAKGPGSRMANAQLFLKRLEDHHNGQTLPGICFFRSCHKVRETIPAIQTNPNNLEEPADGGDDHWHDSVMYACAFASHGIAGITTVTAADPWDEDRERDTKERGYDGYGSTI